MSTLQEKVRRYQQNTISELIDRQNDDGSWTFCFEGPIMTNSFLFCSSPHLMKVKMKKNSFRRLQPAFAKISSQTERLTIFLTKQAAI